MRIKCHILISLYVVLCLVVENIIAQNTSQNDTNPICTKCKCDRVNKLLDCSNAKILNLFNNDEWKKLNDTGFVFDTVTFAYNSINQLTRFPQLPIKFLDLSHNAIALIEKRAFYDLEFLEKLDLSYNKIDSTVLAPDVFEGHYDPTEYEPLKHLSVLKLDHNLLHTLKGNTFQSLEALEELYLNENPFKVIDKNTEIALSSIEKLRVLDMSAMELVSLPEHLFHAPLSLQVLNLSANGFHQMPNALQYARNLKELVLDENPINNLDSFNGFPKLPKLERLSLSYISLMEKIDEGALSGLENLKEFYCVHNIHLYEIHADAFSRPGTETKERKEYPPIEKLILHNNNISVLEQTLVASWEDVKVISLQGNPWSCDCRNTFILETLIPQMVKDNEPLTQKLVCASPYQMAGKMLKDLSDKHVKPRCLDKYGNHPEHDGNILIGLLLGICIGVPFTMLVMIIYRRGCFGFIRRGGSDYSRAFYQKAGVYDDTLTHI